MSHLCSCFPCFCWPSCLAAAGLLADLLLLVCCCCCQTVNLLLLPTRVCFPALQTSFVPQTAHGFRHLNRRCVECQTPLWHPTFCWTGPDIVGQEKKKADQNRLQECVNFSNKLAVFPISCFLRVPTTICTHLLCSEMISTQMSTHLDLGGPAFHLGSKPSVGRLSACLSRAFLDAFRHKVVNSLRCRGAEA